MQMYSSSLSVNIYVCFHPLKIQVNIPHILPIRFKYLSHEMKIKSVCIKNKFNVYGHDDDTRYMVVSRGENVDAL